MKIRYLKNHEIDRSRWDNAVRQSTSGLPYAYSWYLDALLGQKWDGLAADDYDLVMPLPWNRKLFGIPQVFQPVFCQQLGVFGAEEKNALPDFLAAIPKRFRYVLLSLANESTNWETWPVDGVFREKENLILPLNKPFDQLEAGFSKSLRKRIRRAGQQLDWSPAQDASQLILFYQKHLQDKVPLSPKMQVRLRALFSLLLEKDKADIYQVKDGHGHICCQGLFIRTDRRIINLFGASDQVGRELYAMHFLLYKVLEKYAGQIELFDFEGSEIPGVAAFFKSFGAQSAPFLEYKRDQLPSLLSRIRERRF